MLKQIGGALLTGAAMAVGADYGRKLVVTVGKKWRQLKAKAEARAAQREMDDLDEAKRRLR